MNTSDLTLFDVVRILKLKRNWYRSQNCNQKAKQQLEADISVLEKLREQIYLEMEN